VHFSENPKKYAAFISYRHVEPDMTIAKKLQEMLEHNQVRPNRHAQRNIRPVFLDTGELPIQESLDDSFLRTGRSFILNVQYVSEIADDIVVMKNGKQIKLPRRNKKELIQEILHKTNSMLVL